MNRLPFVAVTPCKLPNLIMSSNLIFLSEPIPKNP
ncbi:MAG: hypothetical protein ACD_65C00323G0001, partial [uncultured bacterium]